MLNIQNGKLDDAARHQRRAEKKKPRLIDLQLSCFRDSLSFYSNHVGERYMSFLSFLDWCKANNPMLLKQWDVEKNGGLTPSDVSYGSGKKYWWICDYGHSWQDTLYHRRCGLGCPYCSGKRTLAGFNDLQTTNPDLAAQWHPTKNGDLKPTDVSRGSHKMVWWRCEFGHEWIAKVNSRNNGNNCPYCSGKAVLKGFNDLSTTNPRLAAQWHPTKNGDKLPSDFSEHSNKQVWWMCDKGHEWNAVINNRSNGAGCPYCDGIHVMSGFNDLATVNPHLASQWHPTKNGNLKPSDVRASSGQKVWWRCEFGHEWFTSINNRSTGHECPICHSGQRTSFGEKTIVFYISHFIDIVENYRLTNSGMELDIFIPSLNMGIEYDGAHFHKDVQRDMVKNKFCIDNGIKLIRVREKGCPPITDCFVIDVDPLDDHSMERMVHFVLKQVVGDVECDIDVSRDSGSILSLKVTSYKEGTLMNLYPDVYKEIHPEKNGNLNSVSISAFSQTKLWWLGSCGHEWIASVADRSSGHGCPYCKGKMTLEGHNDLASRNPELAAQWHPTRNGDLKPTEVRAGSSKKVWWICERGHEWQAVINDRNNGSDCPFCRHIKNGKDIVTLRPDLVKFWDFTSNDAEPSQVALHSGKKYHWKCPKGHVWTASPNNMSKKKILCSYCNGTAKTSLDDSLNE